MEKKKKLHIYHFYLTPRSETPISYLNGLLRPYVHRFNPPLSHKPCVQSEDFITPKVCSNRAFTDIFTPRVNSDPGGAGSKTYYQ